jgi:hemerythrin-like metal-binding protein
MENIKWSEEFSVGVAVLDEQHQKIIGMINRLIEEASATVRSEIVSDILVGMTQYAEEHFRTEEALMSEHDYPDLVEHRGQHKVYARETIDLSHAAAIGMETVPHAMLDYLRYWWVEHILQEDIKYKAFFAGRGVT